MCKIPREPNAKDHDAPDNHIAREDPAHHISLEDEVRRKLEENVCDIEDCRQPWVLLSYESGILPCVHVSFFSLHPSPFVAFALLRARLPLSPQVSSLFIYYSYYCAVARGDKIEEMEGQKAYLPKTKRGLDPNGRLIRLLDAVAEPHEWEEVSIDLSLEALVLLFCVRWF